MGIYHGRPKSLLDMGYGLPSGRGELVRHIIRIDHRSPPLGQPARHHGLAGTNTTRKTNLQHRLNCLFNLKENIHIAPRDAPIPRPTNQRLDRAQGRYGREAKADVAASHDAPNKMRSCKSTLTQLYPEGAKKMP